MKHILSKAIVVMIALLAMGNSAWGWNGYTKMTVTAVGTGGTVAVNRTGSTPASSEFGAEKEDSYNSNGGAGKYPTHTYYVYAQPAEGYIFAGWYSDQSCNNFISNTQNGLARDLATSAISGSTQFAPKTEHLYAKFESTAEPNLQYTLQANPSQIHYIYGGATDMDAENAFRFPSRHKTFTTAGTLIKEADYTGEQYCFVIQPEDNYVYTNNIYDENGTLVMSPHDGMEGTASVVVSTSVLNKGRVKITSRKKGSTMPCTVTFTPNRDAFSSIKIDNNEQNVTNNQLTTTTGKVLVLYPSDEYTINSVQMNGTAYEYLPGVGGYAITLPYTSAVTITVDATKNSAMQKEVQLNATDLTMLNVYTNTVNYTLTGSTQIQPAATLSLDGSGAVVQVMPKDGHRILSATYTDQDNQVHEMEFRIDGSNEFYCVNVFDANVKSINIATAQRSTTKMPAMLWIDDLTDISTYYVRTIDKSIVFDNTVQNKKLTAGGAGNTFEIYTDATPISMTFQSSDREFHNYITVNGVHVEATTRADQDATNNYLYTLSANVTFGANAVIRVYTKAPTLMGDVTNDGQVSLKDVPAAVKYGLGEGVTNGRQDAADTDANGQISQEEIQAIANKVLNKTNTNN